MAFSVKESILDLERRNYCKRRAKPRFYADEDFPRAAMELLRTRADVLTDQEAGLRAHPDENQSAFALKEGRILVIRFSTLRLSNSRVSSPIPEYATEITASFSCLASSSPSGDLWNSSPRLLDYFKVQEQERPNPRPLDLKGPVMEVLGPKCNERSSTLTPLRRFCCCFISCLLSCSLNQI